MGAIPATLPQMTSQVLFYLRGADMNSTADQQLTKNGSFTNYLVQGIRACNASVSMSNAVGGIYANTAKAAPIIVAASQAYTAFSGSTVGLDLSFFSNTSRDEITTGACYLSLTTPQGSAATADFFVIGIPTG